MPLYRTPLPLSWKALNYGRRSGGHWFREVPGVMCGTRQRGGGSR